MLTVRAVTPFVLVPDLDAALPFYEGLGFECRFRGTDPGYAFLCAHGGALRLLEDDRAEARAAAAQSMVYLDVEDVDALHAEVAPFLATLPAGRVRPPFDQPYGQREMHATCPGGTLLLFGHPIPEA